MNGPFAVAEGEIMEDEAHGGESLQSAHNFQLLRRMSRLETGVGQAKGSTF
jgi:hypothetical protein